MKCKHNLLISGICAKCQENTREGKSELALQISKVLEFQRKREENYVLAVSQRHPSKMKEKENEED